MSPRNPGGFFLMKIALAQLDYHIGNFEQNVAKIISSIHKGKEEGADLVVFSELAICGYPPRDFLEFASFIEECKKGINKIATECIDIAAIVGGPSPNPGLLGKNLFNSAFFMADGRVQKVINKSLLPTYDIFDEYRYFEPGKKREIVEYKGHKIAVTICEDIWDIAEDPMYTLCPMDELAKDRPHFMVNLSASPFDYNHAHERRKVLKYNANKYGIPCFYVNHVGAQTELIFDGGSLVANAKGEIADELAYFTEDFKIYELDALQGNQLQYTKAPASKISLIHDAIVLGIKDYFRKLGFKQAIIGLSGGIDSAVTVVLAAKALGHENVRVLLMPSQFSSQHSVDDSLKLCENLGIQNDIIRIEDIYKSFDKELKPIFGDLPFNIAEENIQARIRGVLLMAVSNKFGNILLNTSNKSEAAVGYSTLYGDMNGGLSVLGDIYKTEVYELTEYINRNKEVIPRNIITKAPSAELRPNQKDSDSLPDYKDLDEILYHYIEKREGPKEIIAMGYDEQLVLRILRLVNINEYKRHQTPPMLRVSPKAFGMGRRMPIVGKYLS